MAAPQPEKLRHLAVCLPLLGLFLLMPPTLLVFGIEMTLADVPLIVIYIFGVWGGLIAAAAALSRYLTPRSETGSAHHSENDGRHGGPIQPSRSEDKTS